MNIRAANGREIVLGPGLEPLRTKNAAGSRSTWFDGGNRTTWPLVNTRAFVASRKGIRSREDWSAFAIIAASHRLGRHRSCVETGRGARRNHRLSVWRHVDPD